MWRKIICKLGFHPKLNVIQSFGASQHIGCPDCGREFGIHHGLRQVIPWDADIDSLYKDFGYDIEAARMRWHKRIGERKYRSQ